MAKNEVSQVTDERTRTTSFTVLLESEGPAVANDDTVEKSRSSSDAGSDKDSIPRVQGIRAKFRSLKRRSSVENFGQFGFLVPALALFPQADGSDALTQQFGDLQGSHRELKLAAAHIDDALKGRGSYGKARSYFKPRLSQRCFNILDNTWFRRLVICNTLLHSFLIFFEPPSVNVSSVHPLVLAVNFFCLLLYFFDLVVHIIFLTWPVFWTRSTEGGLWNGVEFILVCCFTMDFILLLASSFSGVYILQIFRSLRLALILCKVKNIRHIFNVLLTIGFQLSKLFFIVLVFVLMFAAIGVHILMDVYDCNGPLGNSSSTTLSHGKIVPCYVDDEEIVYKGTFNHVGFGMLRLFVLLSTENYPEVMLPALREHSANFIYFGFFVFVGVFFLTAILLAIVVDSYWVYSKKHVKKERSRERAELAKAWNLLDPLGKGTLSINDEKFTKLFHLLKPKNSEAENFMLIEMLDANEDGEVDSFEWTTMLRQVLSLEFEDDEDLALLDETLGLSKWMLRIRESAQFLTDSEFFSHFILILIILHCVLFVLKWKGQSHEVELTVQVIRSGIVTIFLFEGAMRLLSVGKRILDPLEIMDLFLTMLAFISNFVWYSNYPDYFWFRDAAATISSLAVFCRLPFNNRQLKQAVSIFLRVAPVMVDLLCLLGIILFLLASVGMELFYSASETSDGHMYLPACGLGFETFWCSCLILFQMVTTSNWHEIMNSVMEATGNNWSSLYFVAAYILVNMVVMNLFVAIAIEAFNKLGTVDEEQHPRQQIDRQISDVASAVVDLQSSVKHHAVHMISSVANSLFGSVRADQIAERRQSLAATAESINLKSSTLKRGSILKVRRGTIAEEKAEQNVKEKDEVFEKNEGKGDKRERVLKKRMKEKKRAKQKMGTAEQKVRVVTAFRGNKVNDLELQVGDEVVVLAKKDDWWKGRCKNRIGWFPASHVILRAVKAVPEYGNREVRQSTTGGEVLEVKPPPQSTPDENDNQVQEVVEEKSPSSLTRKENSFFRERSSTGGNFSVGTHPPVRSRMKMKKSGDWRREILGDLTVMNAEELRELNNIMRAELRTPSGLRSKRLGPLRIGSEEDSVRECPINEDLELKNIQQGRPSSAMSFDPRSSGRLAGRSVSPLFNKSPVSPSSRVRSISVCSDNRSSNVKHRVPSWSSEDRSPSMKHRLPAMEFFSPGTPTPPSTHTDQLNAAPSPSSPSNLSFGISSEPEKKEKQKTGNNGEMPEWMINFVTTNNLVVGKDVKLDESIAAEAKKRSFTSSGTVTKAKAGSKTGSKTSARSSRSGTRLGPSVAKRSGSSPTGSRRPSVGRPITPAKGTSRK